MFLKLFNMIDLDSSGWVEIEELLDLMTDIGFQINEKTLKTINDRFGTKLNF